MLIGIFLDKSKSYEIQFFEQKSRLRSLIQEKGFF